MSLPPSLTTAGQNLNVSDPSGRLTRLACSSVDLLWVMSYAPGHGDEGTPISVNFTCKADLSVGIHVRLVVGRRAVTTQVYEVDPPGCGRWQLEGRAPPFSKQKSPSIMVPLTIQAVDKENHVVDSVTFGDFLYHDIDNPPVSVQPVAVPQPPPTSAHPPRRPSLRISSSDGVDRSSKRHSPYSQPQTPSSDSENASSQGSRSNAPALRRASRQMGSDIEDTSQTVILDITTPLDSFCFDWEESELHAGRRLVRFRRLQDGNRLIVSAERVSQADFNPDDIVISCIYREETDSCCVTSVDIIHLLQRLVEADFEVDEKNRIRRNLEGLRPTTVSKSRPGFESFFQRIMDFPDPKPRKIEKDVKVFDWKLLPHALDKILSKYSLHASPSACSPKDEIPSPPFSPTFPQETFSSSGSAYTDNAPQLPREPQLDAFYLSHVSPVVELASFPSECSPHSSPEMHRRPSLQEELNPVYIDLELMQELYPESDVVSTSYGAPSNHSGPLHHSLSMYTIESSPNILTRDATSAFVTESLQPSTPVEQHAEWGTTSCTTSDTLLTSPYVPVFSPAPTYGYNPSNTAAPINVYGPPHPPSSYPIHAYDSFGIELRAREHNVGVALTSQHA